MDIFFSMKIDFYDFLTGVLKQSPKSHDWQLHGLPDGLQVQFTIVKCFRDCEGYFDIIRQSR